MVLTCSKSRRKAVGRATLAVLAIVVVVVAAIGAYAAIVASSGGTTMTLTSVSTSTQQASTVTTTTTSTTIATSISTLTTTSSSTQGPLVTINGAGSTLVFPLMSAWTFAYNQVAPNVHVNYASVGSGAGIAQITAGTVDFGASDAPMTTTQYAALKATAVTIPESASAVVPAYNIPGISSSTHLKFTGDILARIFLANITQWNDPALVALNSGVTLPVHAITVVHRSDGSGTMYAFTNYLSDSNSQWKTKVGYATSVNWPTGLGCKGNEGVAGCIANTQYSIGPLEIAYQITNPGAINYGSVRNAAGNFILANLTNTAASVAAGGTKGLPAGNAQWTHVSIIDSIFNDTAATNAYPITTFTYLFVYQQQTDQVKGTALVNFLWWVVNSAQQGGASLGYVPLPANIVTLDDATINSITYNGTPLHTGP